MRYKMRTMANLDDFDPLSVFPIIEGRVSKTIQSAKDETDINIIVKRFGVTGQLPQVSMPPSPAEFRDVFDFQSAMNVIVAARQSFEALPAEVRARFGNSPEAFLQFCDRRGDDGKLTNLVEMRKMGLVLPEAEIVPERVVKVEVVSPTPA